eukprot:3242081-Prymnesium_polylepis.1
MTLRDPPSRLGCGTSGLCGLARARASSVMAPHDCPDLSRFEFRAPVPCSAAHIPEQRPHSGAARARSATPHVRGHGGSQRK